MTDLHKRGLSKVLLLQYFVWCFADTYATFTCPRQLRTLCRCHAKYDGVVNKQERLYIDCSSGDLQDTPVFNIDENTRIFKVSLQNNSIPTISVDSFPRRLNVNTLDISGNPIGNSLAEGLFRMVTSNLKQLFARTIGVSLERPIGFIKGLKNLEDLDLSRNLRFSRTIPDNMFTNSGTHSLKRLSLSTCGLYAIEDGAFRGLNNLHMLDLSYNFLSKIPRAIQSLFMLRSLNLRKNDILHINREDFRELRCLEELDLSKNLLGQMDAFKNEAFVGLENSLQYLALQDSHMVTIPTLALSRLTKLRTLDISYNKISFMSDRSFIGGYAIEDLDISGNPWLLSDDMFDGVKDSLVNLTLRGIDLQVVPAKSLSKLTKLRKLDLSYNEITRLTNESLSGITARWLVFKGNKIQHISPKAFTEYRLPVKVDFSHNRLGSVDFVFRSPKCTFYSMKISQNNLTCDCEVEKLINTISVEELTGNCLSDNGETFALSDAVIRRQLVRRCGRSERTYCAWWIPKQSAGTPLLCHMLITILGIMLQLSARL